MQELPLRAVWQHRCSIARANFLAPNLLLSVSIELDVSFKVGGRHVRPLGCVVGALPNAYS